MLRSVQSNLAIAQMSLEDVGSDTALTQLLLGSLPPTVAQALGDNTASHRNILRASSQYIKRVHDMRWTRGLVHSDADGGCGFVSPSPSNTTC